MFSQWQSFDTRLCLASCILMINETFNISDFNVILDTWIVLFLLIPWHLKMSGTEKGFSTLDAYPNVTQEYTCTIQYISKYS